MSRVGSRVSILWVVAAFVIMTVSEVMASVIGLELAFRAAPARMKSFVTACWLLTVFGANLLTIPIAGLKLYEGFGPGPFFAGYAVAKIAAAAVFAVIGRRFQRQAA
jgi:solute carrier family 15 (oligopeptide transporter), member 1